MQETQPALPLRAHTVLGVCEAIGEDFGFNPLWLRILLASFLIWKPVEVIGVYFALGALVLISRLLVPARRGAATCDAAQATIEQDLESGADRLPMAA
jgi:phage shock protein C